VKRPDDNHHRESDQTQNEQETAEAVEGATAADGGGAHEMVSGAALTRLGEFGSRLPDA
jgi:hypothetical protein